MKQVVLVNINKSIRRKNTEWELPLNLLSLSNHLRKNGYAPIAFDIVPEEIDDIVDRIVTISPLFVGISCIFDATGLVNLSLYRKLKDKSDIPILLGGIAVTMSPDLYLSEEGIDFIVQGEGEVPIVEFAEYMEGKRKLENISGLGYYNGRKKQFNDIYVSNDLGEVGYDLDCLQTDWGKYVRNETLFSFKASRGCPYQCSFCYNSCFHIKYKTFPVDHVVNDIKRIRDIIEFDKVRMIDDHLFVKKDWAFSLLEELFNHGISIYFADTRAEDITPGFLSKLKSFGCSNLFFGSESENPRILKIFQKKLDPKYIIKAFEASEKIPGFTLSTSFIIGAPGQTRNEVISSGNYLLDLLMNYPKNHIHMQTYIPVSGTVLYKTAVREGLPEYKSIKELVERTHLPLDAYTVFEYPWLKWCGPKETRFLNRIRTVVSVINRLIKSKLGYLIFKTILHSRFQKRFSKMDLDNLWELWILNIFFTTKNKAIATIAFLLPRSIRSFIKQILKMD